MPNRKPTNTLQPPDASVSPSGSGGQSTQKFPRAASPSSGLGNLFTKPSKWFKSSPAAARSISASAEPRSSTSSASRKPKISRPTDPRPILPTLQSDSYISGARSVLDLSLHQGSPPSAAPRRSGGLDGTGDLRNISRKTWSRSADDLGRYPNSSASPAPTINTQLRDKVEEYRSLGSPVSSRAPDTPWLDSPQPFPSTPSLSSSPPPSAPTLKISPSGPPTPSRKGSAPPSPADTPTQVHAHTRSQSFTPRLPSKLALQRVATGAAALAPPTPVRKNSAGSIHSDTDRERKRTGSGDKAGSLGSSSMGSSSRPGFPWPLSHKPSPPISAPVSPGEMPGHRGTQTFLAPPVIVEPEGENGGGNGSTKRDHRSSQIVHHSGFVNRLMNFAAAPASGAELQPTLTASSYWSGGYSIPNLSKGWKPFKVILKGSKLYFYKPPYDRAAGVRELFPVGVAAVEEEDENATTVEEEEQAEAERTRKQDSARKRRAYWGRGTHPELVLSEGELRTIQRGSFEALIHEAVFRTTFAGFVADSDEAGAGFAAAVMLCVPTVVERAKFEAEFQRCCNYLVSGAEEGERDLLLARTGELARWYLKYHEAPADASAWENWKQELLPNISLEEPLPIVEPSPPPSTQVKPGKASTRLKREHLTRDNILLLDQSLLARSLTAFQRSIFANVPITLSLNTIVEPHADEDDAQEYRSVNSEAFETIRLFFGTETKPHWLTKLVLTQILASESSKGSTDPSGRPDVRRQRGRSGVIGAWAIVGEVCRLAGDACSWRAIAAALMCRPIARLSKAWKKVDAQALAVVRLWAEEDECDVREPRATPWGGDAHVRVRSALEALAGDPHSALDVSTITRARAAFGELEEAFGACARRAGSNAETAELQPLLDFWRDLAADRLAAGSFATKLARVEQFLPLSLAVEPRRLGMFEPHFWTPVPSPQAGQTIAHPLVPLLFPEPFPTLTFIDRTHIWRGRTESGAAALNAPDVQFFRQNLDQTLKSSAQQKRLSASGVPLVTLGGVDLAGTVIPVDDELMLLVQNRWDPSPRSRPSSRPSSRAPSRPPSSVVDGPPLDRTISRKASTLSRKASTISRKASMRRLPHGAAVGGLERTGSVNRRASLPPPAARSPTVTIEEPLSNEKPLRVVIQAGTLERLVSVLIFGLERISVSTADDSGEAPLREKATRDLYLDRDEFAEVWWTVFRSFVTPLVFFELLRKRYVGATPRGQDSKILPVLNTRSSVLAVLQQWIRVGGGAQDVLDDTDLHNAVQSFLDSSIDHHLPEIDTEKERVRKALDSYLAELEAFRLLYKVEILRPTLKPDFPTLRDESIPRVATTDPPNLDTDDALTLVDDIDAMAYSAFGLMTDEDLLIAAELLEVQTADKIGWLLARELGSIPDEIDIQTIHSYILDIEPSSLVPELGQDRLYRLFPASVRTSLRAHEMLRRWLVSHLADATISVGTRHARAIKLLDAIEITRKRSYGSSAQPVGQRVCVRSFTESVLVSAVLSSPSRAYYHVWQMAASERRVSMDLLSSMFIKGKGETLPERLTVDLGWLLERLLEFISLPNVTEDGGRALVNFDKRRLIAELVSTHVRPASVWDTKHGTSAMERMNKIEKQANAFSYDIRLIREQAHREREEASKNGHAAVISAARRGARPFQKLVNSQIEKNKRDKALRERLLKEKRAEQTRSDRREDQLNRAMHLTRKQTTTVRKEHRNKKSVSAAFNFLQFMRPISSAFSSESLSSSGVRRSAADLDFVPTGKPSLVLSIADAHVSKFINNERSYLFQLDTEDGGHYLLQAPTQKDAIKWMETIGRSSQIAARRRLTWIGNSPKPQVMDHIPDRPAATSRDPRAVFGVELTTLLRREALDGDVQPGAIPLIIQYCLAEVEKRGFEEVGIYRIAGAQSEINALKEAFNRGEMPIQSSSDIHAVCDVVKTWLRQLPEAAFPTRSYFAAIEAAKNQDLDARLKAIRLVVHSLPQAHFDLLKRIAEHLYEITEYENQNQMSEEALAIVFSPNLLRSPVDDFAMIMSNMGATIKIIRALITHFHVIFDDSVEHEEEEEAEGEAEGEVEGEARIIEGSDLRDSPLQNMSSGSEHTTS